MDSDEIREWVRALLPDLSDDEWEWLVEERYVADVLRGESTPEELARAVRRLPHRRAAAPEGDVPPMVEEITSTRRTRPRSSLSRRAFAISRLIAQDAATDQEVRAFRQAYLPERLLAHDEVEGWIEAHREKDARPSRWLPELPLPPETQTDLRVKDPTFGGPTLLLDPPVHIDRLRARRGYPAIGTHIKTLEYAAPEDRWVRRVPTIAGTLLEELRYLSEELARRYRWQASQATIFVLTGLTPLLAEVRSTVEFRAPYFALSRIALVVDPAVSPRELAERYRQVRQELLPGRSRPLTDKHIELALFTAERPDAERWAEQMAGWNAAHPEWRYEQVSNFSRDARQAQRRLLEPDYPTRGLARRQRRRDDGDS
jgi:hypothetical protein